MDIHKTTQRIKTIQSKLSESFKKFERKTPSHLVLANGQNFPITLQELRRTFSPKQSQTPRVSNPFIPAKVSKSLLPLTKIFYKSLLSILLNWKTLTFPKHHKYRKQASTFIFPSNNLSRCQSSYIQATPFNERKSHMPTSSRQKTICKLESSIKFLRTLKKVQKKQAKFSFFMIKSFKTHAKFVGIFKKLLKFHFSSVFTTIKLVSRQRFSIVSACPFSITPVPRKLTNLTMTQENSFKIKPGSTFTSYTKDLNEVGFNLKNNFEESGSFDLPNLSSYDSLDYSHKLLQKDQYDSLEISNSNLYLTLNDDSLVELEDKDLKNDLSPDLSPLIQSKEQIPELAYKSASTASIPQKFMWCNRYSTQSNETISEVSNSRGSLNKLPKYKSPKEPSKKTSKKSKKSRY